MHNKNRYRIVIIGVFLLVSNVCGCIEQQLFIPDGEVKFRYRFWWDEPSILPNWSDDQYHDYYDMTNVLFDFHGRYDHLVDLMSIGSSVLGKPLWVIKITNEAVNHDKYCCLIDGCIHGSEWESADACLYLAEYLLLNFGRNKTVTDILNETTVYLLPMVNPDGRQQDYRFNEHGIDLNRNFDVHFGRIRGHSIPLGMLFGRIKIPRVDLPIVGFLTNSGRRPFSEPETKAVRTLMHTLASERFSFYITCHTATHQFLYPWSTFKPVFEISEQQQLVFSRVTRWVGDNTEYEATKLGYKASGTSMDWCFMKFRVPSFTFELLSAEYEPRSGGGRHDHLVHWMKTALPVFLFLLVNSDDLYAWDIPDSAVALPEGVPPDPL